MKVIWVSKAKNSFGCFPDSGKRISGWALIFGLLASMLHLGSPLSAGATEGSGGKGLTADSVRPSAAPLSRGLWHSRGAGDGRGEAAQSIARAPNGEWAVGDQGGVSWWRRGEDDFRNLSERQEEGGLLRRASLPEVRDLVFDGRGDLWIATAAGLYRWKSTGRPERRPLRGGEAAPGLSSIVASGGVVVAAGEAGAYWSSTGKIFQPLNVGGVGASIRQVAVHEKPVGTTSFISELAPGGSVELWLLGAPGLLRLRGLVTASGLRVLEKERVDLPRPTSERSGAQLVVDPLGTRLALVYPDLVAVRALEPRQSGGEEAPTWHRFRPVLAPGAAIRSLAWGANQVVLSTDHGVFVSERLSRPFARAAPPVGTEACVEALAPISGRPWIVLCQSGVYAHRSEFAAAVRDPENSGGAKPRSSLLGLPPNPPLEEIRRRALGNLGLSARRSAELWSGLRRRAYWPEVELRFDVDFERDRQWDLDEAFISGDTRELVDFGHDRSRRFGGSISLDWDLGGIAYPNESVNLSRELRQVISLRDDVSDEINQLYFERKRLRARLAGIEAGAIQSEPGERTRLYFRAREIDAGLDAWTDGFLERWRSEPRKP